MDPIFLKVGGLTIRWYGVMVAVGYMAALFVLQRRRKEANMSSDQVYDIAFIALIAGILGARLFYVVQFWGKYQNNILKIFRIDEGGLVFYGGFICSLISLFIYSKKKKLSLLSILDVYAPAMALGHVFGRIGCLVNSCCYGKACSLPWAITYGDKYRGMLDPDVIGVARHPVQLYEAFGNFALFAFLYWILGKLKRGQTAALYLILYGILRLTDEFLRGDHSDYFLNVFTPAQTICVFVILPLGIILYLSCRKNPIGPPPLPETAVEDKKK